jgi:hypothetical protein
MEKQVNAGLKIITDNVEQGGRLRVARTERLFDRDAYKLELESKRADIQLVIAHEFLSDLPAMKKYQTSVHEYFSCLNMRLENADPFDFYCKTGAAVHLEIDRFLERVPLRAASYLRASVKDIRHADAIAKCVVIITDGTADELGPDPFRREKLLVNRIRNAVDGGEIVFHPAASHPAERQELTIDAVFPPAKPTLPPESQRFVAGKVYWLGFKRGNKATGMWVPDPWDAEYLGVDPKALQQAAEILEAEKLITFVPDPGLATASEGLLQASAIFETPQTEPRKIGFSAS